MADNADGRRTLELLASKIVLKHFLVLLFMVNRTFVTYRYWYIDLKLAMTRNGLLS